MARWSWQERGVGFARQSDLTTIATSGFEYFPAEVSIPDFVRSVEEFEFGTAQVGASGPPAVGGKHGTTFSVRYPLQSMLSGYDGSTYTGGISAVNNVLARTAVLLQHAIGGNTGGVSSNQDLMDGKLGYDEVYDGASTQAGGTTAKTVAKASTGANYDEGNFLFASAFVGGGPSATPVQAFIKSISTDDLNHVEASNNVSLASDTVWPTNTTPYTGDEPDPLTFRITGDNDSFGLKFTGCVPQSWSVTLNAGQTPMVEINYTCTDKQWDTTIGGLELKDLFLRLPPALGGQGAYASFGEVGSAAVTCGLHDFTISGESDLHFVPCHSKAQGFSEVVVTNRRITASFALPHASGDPITSDGEHTHEERFRTGTAVSVGLFVGFVPGQVFAAFMPSWHITEQPTLEDVEGVLYHRLALRAGEYTGDTGITKAANSIFRIAFA
jgi:hypothetical protein